MGIGQNQLELGGHWPTPTDFGQCPLILAKISGHWPKISGHWPKISGHWPKIGWPTEFWPMPTDSIKV